MRQWIQYRYRRAGKNQAALKASLLVQLRRLEFELDYLILMGGQIERQAEVRQLIGQLCEKLEQACLPKEVLSKVKDKQCQ